MKDEKVDVEIFGEEQRIWEKAKLISSQALQEAKDSIVFNEAIFKMAEEKIKELGV